MSHTPSVTDEQIKGQWCSTDNNNNLLLNALISNKLHAGSPTTEFNRIQPNRYWFSIYKTFSTIWTACSDSDNLNIAYWIHVIIELMWDFHSVISYSYFMYATANVPTCLYRYRWWTVAIQSEQYHNLAIFRRYRTTSMCLAQASTLKRDKLPMASNSIIEFSFCAVFVLTFIYCL